MRKVTKRKFSPEALAQAGLNIDAAFQECQRLGQPATPQLIREILRRRVGATRMVRGLK